MHLASAFRTSVAAVCVLALLSACASVAQVPAQLQTMGAGAPSAVRTLHSRLDIELDTGYSRSIAAGSQWRQVGSIEQGAVYQPHQNVFTLEGANIHEAYLVVDKDKLVGFYLPAERGFSTLRHQLPVNFE